MLARVEGIFQNHVIFKRFKQYNDGFSKLSTDSLTPIDWNEKTDKNWREVGKKKTHTDSLVGISIEDVREVVVAVFFKAEVLNRESDILPLLHSYPPLRGL